MLVSILAPLVAFCSFGLSLPAPEVNVDVNITSDTIYVRDVDLPAFLEARGEVEERQPGGIFICTDINWGGTCGYAKQPFDLCIVLTSPYYHTISSFGPDSGNAAVFSQDNGCAGNAYSLFYPGSADLRNQGWNDLIGSFRVREVSVVNGRQCIGSVDNNRLPGVNCQFCCNGCDRSGQDCCPDGVIC